jgi:Topoisomerase 6 subunit A/Spo11, Toprim domain
VVRRHLPAVYERVSGGLGARCRQLFYGLRPCILAETDRNEIDDAYIMYTLIPDFIAENPVLCADWIVFYDDRGHLLEPHTKKVVGLGTRNVRDYLESWHSPSVSGFFLALPSVDTAGPAGRYGAILFTEKEGFNELFQAAQLPERFDLCLASTKGTSVTAARELFEEAGTHGIPIFALHDLDYNGFEIAATLRRDTRRYQFDRPPEIIDIGLRLADVERLALQSEPVVFGNRKPDALCRNLRLNGASEAEIAYLINGKQRVELNAMTSPQLITLIEDALVANGVSKVIPNADTLAAAYRSRFTSPQQVREQIDAFINAYNQDAHPFEWTKQVVHSRHPRAKYADLRN